MPRLVQVIESEIIRGCGITFCKNEWDSNDVRHEHQMMRTVTQWHTLEGEFIGERDSAPGGRPLRHPLRESWSSGWGGMDDR